ncbi:MAG: hypothetical protein IPM54_09935 [Polyangiaceae bacterium]|nr:hypothetical protein [Polyangiaceae bacterium]
MWVERANGTALDEWVSRPGAVDGYLDVVQEVLDYLRVTQRNAESYHASLAGKLGRDLERARRLQEKIIADQSADPKTRIQKMLLDKGAKEKDPLKAEIAADKQTMGDVQAMIDKTKVDAEPYGPKEVITMYLTTLMSLGVLELASAGFHGGEPIPNGAGVDASTASAFMSPMLYSPSAIASAPAAPAGIRLSTFKPSEFPFIITVQDDGTGKAGGWQVAKVNLEFIRIVIPKPAIKWYCFFTIQMPLRTEFMGKVDASRAATLSATVANGAAATMDYKLPPGIFCEKFIVGTRAAFKSTYPLLGAAVIK